jgi:hypothetical protein
VIPIAFQLSENIDWNSGHLSARSIRGSQTRPNGPRRQLFANADVRSSRSNSQASILQGRGASPRQALQEGKRLRCTARLTI